MKTIITRSYILIAAILLTGFYMSFGQNTNANTNNSSNSKQVVMKTYVIERDIPEIGKANAEQLKAISVKSCSVIQTLGPNIEWVQSYVTGNKIYCVYRAESEEILREHAKLGGFPCNSIQEVKNVISPKTAEQN
jgi:uncharacterized protein DUF4242